MQRVRGRYYEESAHQLERSGAPAAEVLDQLVKANDLYHRGGDETLSLGIAPRLGRALFGTGQTERALKTLDSGIENKRGSPILWWASCRFRPARASKLSRPSTPPIEFGRLQHSIRPEAAVVQYFPTEDTLYFFVVTAEEFRLRSLKVGKAELDESIQAVRRGLVDPKAAPPAALKTLYTQQTPRSRPISATKGCWPSYPPCGCTICPLRPCRHPTDSI